MNSVAVASPGAAAPPTRLRGGAHRCVRRGAIAADVERAVGRRSDAPPASDPESLLLACCAAQIAAVAGADAVVHAIASPQQALLLGAAVDRLATSADDARRRALVYVPRTAATLLDADELRELLRGLAARHGGDAVLVVAVESSPRATPASVPSTRTIGATVALVEQLARAVGWQLCQLWSDGTARHALVVFDRADAGAVFRAS